MFLSNGAAALDFDIYDLNINTVIGRAHITPGANNRGPEKSESRSTIG